MNSRFVTAVARVAMDDDKDAQRSLDADAQLAGTPSVTLDAIAVILDKTSASRLCADGAAVQFVMDAFGHLKAIGYNPAAQALIDRAGVTTDDGVTDLTERFIHAAGRRFYEREASVRTLV